MHNWKRIITITLLAIIVTASWSYTAFIFINNKENIIVAFADIVREIALPFRVAILSLEEPLKELPMPVHGVLVKETADTWGEARSQGRSHEGTDIFAKRGTFVFSATKGYVTRTNFGFRGGENVMIAGPGGINYYYAHFDRIADGIKRGVEVTSDTIIGFVGNSGNATNTPPHLHFGIYPEEWEAINPYPLLVDR